MLIFIPKNQRLGSGCLARLLVLLSFYFFLTGCHSTYTALTSGTQLVISCGDYITRMPRDKWVKLTKARPDVGGLCFSKTFGQISEVFIPLVPDSETSVPSNFRVIFASDSKAVLDAAKLVSDAGDDLVKQLKAEV